MLDDILDYIDSYENIRAACGLNYKELPDTELALVIYKNRLAIAFEGISGVYAPSEASQTLPEIFEDLEDSDVMYSTIQTLAIYIVADCVMGTIGLKSFKTQSDGKASIVRFSAESTYLESRRSIREMRSQYTKAVNDLLGVATEEKELISAVGPLVDIVTGG